MVKILYFKAKKRTKRFKKNQKVWVIEDCGNHAYIVFRYRGKGRYVTGIINKYKSSFGYNNAIGEDGFKEIEVNEKFYNNLNSKILKKYFGLKEIEDAFKKLNECKNRMKMSGKETVTCRFIDFYSFKK